MVGMWKVTETTLLTYDKNKQDKSQVQSFFLSFLSSQRAEESKKLKGTKFQEVMNPCKEGSAPGCFHSWFMLG